MPWVPPISVPSNREPVQTTASRYWPKENSPEPIGEPDHECPLSADTKMAPDRVTPSMPSAVLKKKETFAGTEEELFLLMNQVEPLNPMSLSKPSSSI